MVEISLNVYELPTDMNRYLGYFAMKAYHTGVQVGNNYEYCFSSAGIQRGGCRLEEYGLFHEQIKIGLCRFSEINGAVATLRENQFSPGIYDSANKNCSHFSQALLDMLFPEVEFPAYINRLAYFSSFFAPKLPSSNEDVILPQIGTTSTTSTTSSSSHSK